MACCILAAFLFAQFMAMLRRWAVFWGLVRPGQGEVADTILTRTRAVLRKPLVRAAVGLALVVELGSLSAWLYVNHGTHIAEEVDVAWSRLHGQRVIYAGVCGVGGRDQRLRMVLDLNHRKVG